MAATHEVEVLHTSERRTIEEPEPLTSARLFKHLSDEIWKLNPDDNDMHFLRKGSPLAPEDALIAINEALRTIDEDLVVADGSKEVTLQGGDNNKRIVLGSTSLPPSSFILETSNHDDLNNLRQVFVEKPKPGEQRAYYLKFLDGHQDYSRYLAAKCRFLSTEGGFFGMTIDMSRDEAQQHLPVELRAQAWSLNDGGASSTHEREITEAQEMGLLRVFADIGGVSLDGFTE